MDRAHVTETIAKLKPHVLVPLMCRLGNEAIQAGEGSVKLIHQFGAGLEGVDKAAAAKAGIKVMNIPACQTPNAASCAEHAMFLALSLYRRSSGMEQALRNRMLGDPIGRYTDPEC